MDQMSGAARDFPLDEAALRRCRLLCDSFARLLGRALLPGLPHDDLARARALYDADPVIVAHDAQPDPVFWFANRAAQRLWELDWERFTRLPSRLSAEPEERTARAALLHRVATAGFIDDYRGVRISGGGRRFRIEGALVWTVTDDHGRTAGQAATFARWEFL